MEYKDDEGIESKKSSSKMLFSAGENAQNNNNNNNDRMLERENFKLSPKILKWCHAYLDLDGHFRDSPLNNANRSKSPGGLFSFVSGASNKDKENNHNRSVSNNSSSSLKSISDCSLTNEKIWKAEIDRLIQFENQPLIRPLIKTKDKRFKKEAVAISQLIMQYTGVGKYKRGKGGTSNLEKLSILMEILNKVYASQNLMTSQISSGKLKDKNSNNFRSSQEKSNSYSSLGNSLNASKNSGLTSGFDEVEWNPEPVHFSLVDELYLQLMRQCRYQESNSFHASSNKNSNSTFQRTGSVRSFKEYKKEKNSTSPSQNSPQNNVSRTSSKRENSSSSKSRDSNNKILPNFSRENSVLGVPTRDRNPSSQSKNSLKVSNSNSITNASSIDESMATKLASWKIFATLLNFMLPNDQHLQEILAIYLAQRQRTLSNSKENLLISTCIMRLTKSLRVVQQRQSTTNKTHHSRRSTTNAQISQKPSLKELEHSIYCIFSRSIFGSTVSIVISDQKNRLQREAQRQKTVAADNDKNKNANASKNSSNKEKLPTKNITTNPIPLSKRLPIIKQAVEQGIPWLLVELSTMIKISGGYQFEGIFRIPGDVEHMSLLKMHLDKWSSIKDLDKNIRLKLDPAVYASLIKQWFRELEEPLIPKEFYWDCTNDEFDWSQIKIQFNNMKPDNYRILKWLIMFLQSFLMEEVIVKTKMNSGNLAMIWAPNILKCPISDPTKVIEYSVREMKFCRFLIEKWDANYD